MSDATNPAIIADGSFGGELWWRVAGSSPRKWRQRSAPVGPTTRQPAPSSGQIFGKPSLTHILQQPDEHFRLEARCQPPFLSRRDAGVADHAVRVEVAGDPGEGMRAGLPQQ